MISDVIIRRASRVLLSVGPLATLAISPTKSYDPINLVKLLFISTLGFLALGMLLSSNRRILQRLPRKIWLTYLGFLLALIAPLVFTNAPITQQLWGMFGRNTGFVAYVSLSAVLISISLIQEKNFYTQIVNWLLITTVPVSLYCLIQIAGLDPVGWSSSAPFATLGNVNFLSAYLGISCVIGTVFIFDTNKSKTLRIGISALCLIDLLIINNTGSIQGIMVFIAGFGISLFFIMRNSKNRLIKNFTWPYFGLGTLGFITSFLALLNKGPLATFIYQPTILFRMDYMHAAWETTLKNPIFGVGLDSFGDWYRANRGFISAIRTTQNRTSNSAHNIFLDISASGGFLLLFAYLLLLGFAFYSAIRVLKKMKSVDFTLIAIFGAWIGYQVQSMVSINQIGVGVWGWIFTGALIGYSRINLEQQVSNNISERKRKTSKSSSLPASVGLFAVISMAFGFIISFIPFNADMKFKTAIQTHDLNKMIESTNALGTTAWHLSQVAQSAVTGNFSVPAIETAARLRKDFPREIYGWEVLYSTNTGSKVEKDQAVAAILRLDPDNPCLNPNPVQFIRNKVEALPSSEQLSLVKTWGIDPALWTNMPESDFSINKVPAEAINTRLVQFCPNQP